MCHEWFMRRERRREERFDEELRYLLDERELSEPPATVVKHEVDEPAQESEPVGVEAETRV